MEVVRLKLDKAYCGLSRRTLFAEKLDTFMEQLNNKFNIHRVYLNHVEKASLQAIKEQLLEMSITDVTKSELTLQVERKNISIK